MTFYFAMINAWSLAWEALYGDMDKEYPIIDTSVGAGNTAAEKTNRYDNDGLDYEVDLNMGGLKQYSVLKNSSFQYLYHYLKFDLPDFLLPVQVVKDNLFYC